MTYQDGKRQKLQNRRKGTSCRSGFSWFRKDPLIPFLGEKH